MDVKPRIVSSNFRPTEAISAAIVMLNTVDEFFVVCIHFFGTVKMVSDIN